MRVSPTGDTRNWTILLTMQRAINQVYNFGTGWTLGGAMFDSTTRLAYMGPSSEGKPGWSWKPVHHERKQRAKLFLAAIEESAGAAHLITLRTRNP